MKAKFQFLKLKPVFMRIDVIIFSILYPLTILPCIRLLSQNWISESPETPTKNSFAFIVDHLDIENLEPYTFLVCSPAIVASTHLLIFLFSNWFISFNSWLKYSKAKPEDATHVWFVQTGHKASSEIVKLDRSTTPPSAVFQEKKRAIRWQSSQEEGQAMNRFTPVL